MLDQAGERTVCTGTGGPGVCLTITLGLTCGSALDSAGTALLSERPGGSAAGLSKHASEQTRAQAAMEYAIPSLLGAPVGPAHA